MRQARRATHERQRAEVPEPGLLRYTCVIISAGARATGGSPAMRRQAVSARWADARQGGRTGGLAAAGWERAVASRYRAGALALALLSVVGLAALLIAPAAPATAH